MITVSTTLRKFLRVQFHHFIKCSFLQLSDELSGISSISFSLSMAISSSFSILSEDVIVVVVGVSVVKFSLAVVVWNGSGWTLVVFSLFGGKLLASEIGRMVVVLVVLVGGVVVELPLWGASLDVIRIGSITNFSLSTKPPSSATTSSSPPKSTKGCMIPGPVLPFSGGPRGSLVSTSSATLFELNSTGIASLEGFSIMLSSSKATSCSAVSSTDLSSSSTTTNFPSLSSSGSSSGSSSVEGLYGVRLTKLVKGFSFWGVL